MWKRIELHNHTIESDGCMTVRELVSFLSSKGISAFSLTDHNTISGWEQLAEAAREIHGNPEFIYGYELTSYFGHMLCQNVFSYIPWDDIDEGNADLLFQRVHDMGGLAGPAHPFSIPFPFSTGMRWSMKIHDFRLVDFIEIINNAHPMTPDNKNAVLWWEKLIFEGFPIAPTAGLDLHRPQLPQNAFTTFLNIPDGAAALPLKDQLNQAVKSLNTCVTRGPIADWREENGCLTVFLEPGTDSYCPTGDLINSPVPEAPETTGYLCQLRTAEKHWTRPLDHGVCSFPLSNLPASVRSAVILVFQGRADWDHLIAAARPFFR